MRDNYFNAVHAGDDDAIATYLPLCVNIRSAENKTALQYACEALDEKLIEMLLSHGANPNQFGGTSPLGHVSSKIGDSSYRIAKSLIKAGADINAISMQVSPLMAASFVGNTRMVELLLDSGADISLTTKEKFNAFNFALRGRRMEVIKILCDKHPDLDICRQFVPLDSPTHAQVHDIINATERKRALESRLSHTLCEPKKHKI